MAEAVWDSSELVGRLRTIEPQMSRFVYAAAKYHASRAQTYARKNAPWTDRTSNARNGLFGRAFKEGKRTGFVIAGTVTYQPYLEVRWGGRYAIIRPTVQHEGPEFMKTISQGFAQIFGAS